MKITRLIFLLLFLFGLQAITTAQVTRIDTVIIDTTKIIPVTLTEADTTVAEDTEEEKPLIKVTPWEFHAPVGADIVATDSTLRWQIWPDWTYKLNREPGVISYRMGTSMRSNTVQRYAHEPRHQQLYWEGVSLNDPVSGLLNWTLIPQHKIGEFYGKDLGTEYRSSFYNRQYYLNEPLSRLIYSESKFAYRDLEFEVSHNFSQRTNLEVSYWDRRSGGEYSNSEVRGRQIYGKLSHHLDDRRFLKLNYMSNKYNIGRPFGYVMPNLSTFNFDRFAATANQPNAFSDETTSLLMLNFYQRSPDTTKAVDNLHGGIFYRGNERLLNYSADTTNAKVQSVGVNAKKWWNIGGLTLEGGGNYEYFLNKADTAGFPADNWSLLKGEGNVLLDFTPIVDLKGGAVIEYRTDGFQSYNLNAESDIKIGGFTLTPGASTGSVMPTPQQLYWSSNGFSGNENLRNEKIQEIRGTLTYNFSPDVQLGVRGQHKDIKDGIMLADSTFANVISYASQSTSAFFEWDLTNFEFDGSVTMHRFTDSYLNPTGTVPMQNLERVAVKGGAYWKGYLFDRATYIKAGVSGMMAPMQYQADNYNPELDFWQPVSDDQFLPVYNRLDVDISARIRSIMVLLRWENVLDDVSQLGYFETAQYPMSGRRFIFSVRALFRD